MDTKNPFAVVHTGTGYKWEFDTEKKAIEFLRKCPPDSGYVLRKLNHDDGIKLTD